MRAIPVLWYSRSLPALALCALAGAPALAQPANNLCSNAQVIAVGAASVTVTGTTVAATSDLPESGCSDNDFNDVWFTFTAPTTGSPTAGYTLHTRGSVLDTTISVFTSCADTLPVYCNDDEDFFGAVYSSYLPNLPFTQNQVVYVRVAGYDGDAASFSLTVVPPPVAPANDACSGSVPALSLGVPVTGSNAGAATDYLPDPSTLCGGGTGAAGGSDVFYRFTPGATDQYRFSTCASSFDTVLAVMSTCAGPVLACNDTRVPFCGNDGSEISALDLTQGVEVFVRVAGYGTTTPDQGNISLIVELAPDAPTPPPNDACVNAHVIATLPFDTGNVPVFAATDDANANPSCDAAGNTAARIGIWYAFTPASTVSTLISYVGDINTRYSIWTGADCNALTELACGGPDSLAFTFTGGVTHYILVSAAPSGTIQIAPDSVYRVRVLPPATNDACANAIIPPSLPYTQAIDTTGTSSDGPGIAAGPDCNSTGAQPQGLNYSIWYRVTPATSGSLRVEVRALFDTLINIYAGNDCSALSLETDGDCVGDGDNGLLDGFDNVDYAVTVPAGASRFIGVGSWGSIGGAAAPGPGTITISFTPDAPTTDNCCRGTTCNSVTAGTCTGLVAGSNSLVRPTCGAGTAFASCCYADFNHDGSQSIDDLFLYFNAYFTSSPWAKFGGNGVAQPAIDDLFLYINAYFGTCS